MRCRADAAAVAPGAPGVLLGERGELVSQKM